MPVATTGMGDRLRGYALNTLGFILMTSLPLLWVAWTKAILLGIVVAGFAAGVLYCVIYAFHDIASRQSGGGVYLSGKKTLSGQFMAELTSLGPWVHHNRLRGDAAFRQKMEVLERLKKKDEDPDES